MYAMLRPTKVKRDQTYISTLMPFKDRKSWMTLLGTLLLNNLMQSHWLMEVLTNCLMEKPAKKSLVEKAQKMTHLVVMTMRVHWIEIVTSQVLNQMETRMIKSPRTATVEIAMVSIPVEGLQVYFPHLTCLDILLTRMDH